MSVNGMAVYRTMKVFGLLIFITVFIQPATGFAAARKQSGSYVETRSLLLKLDTSRNGEDLKKLFEEGADRIQDLIHALYDPEKMVSINAQAVIMYLNDPAGVAAIEEWHQYKQERKQDYWSPKMEVLKDGERRVLKGEDEDLAKLVLENVYFIPGQGPGRMKAKILAFNKNKDKVLIDVMASCGALCGEGWHVVIQKESDGWHYLSVNLVWQS